jgi:hypothetical protein
VVDPPGRSAWSIRLLVVADAGLVRDARDSSNEIHQGIDVGAMVKHKLDGLHATGSVNSADSGIRDPLMGDFIEDSSRQSTKAVSKDSIFGMHLRHALLLTFWKNYAAAVFWSSVWDLW